MKELMARRREVVSLGMELEEWTLNGCIAQFGVGDDWATLYIAMSENPGRGDATQLLLEAKEHYEAQGKKVGGSVAINPAMRHIYEKLGYEEYR